MDKDFLDSEGKLPDSEGVIIDDLDASSASGPVLGSTGTRMVKQKEELSNQMAGATNKIEQLRMKQHELEREKSGLEDLFQKQEKYEVSKSEIMSKLNRSVVLVEKEQVQAVRMSELLWETRELFNDTLSELENIDESTWADGDFRAELDRGLSLVENAKMAYKKALARIEASSWHKSSVKKDTLDAIEDVNALMETKGFGYWFKVGIAVTLPIVIFAALLIVGYFLFRSRLGV